MVLETHSQVLQAVVTVQHTTRTPDLVQQPLESLQETTLVVSVSSQEPFTMVTRTLGTLVRTGAQEPTGHVFLGRMHRATFQVTRLHKTITSGTRTQRRSLSQFPMKGQRTAILHSKRTIRPPSRKHTTTVSTQVSFQSECMDKPTAVLQASNPTSRTWPSARTVSKAQLPETVQATPSVQQTLVVKSTSSHPEAVVQARCRSLWKQWFTSPRTTHVRSTCPFLTHTGR